MAKTIVLKPVEMTAAVMQMLEDRKLIIRLAPGRHELAAGAGETLGESIYEAAESLGPHKLIAVTVNRESLAAFGTHVDNEEFLMLGDNGWRAMYLVVALCMREELAAKIAAGRLTADDFVCLKVKYNDPQVSFFTMLKGVPHGECIAPGAGKGASFYVTESRDMGIDLTDFGQYEVKVISNQ
ncbi:MAG: hypothetical protein LLG01_04305 [Planctomycetaceae bacterium]|nr:hypothetical protein [Planctomycetaceae bacterium]